MMIPAFSNAADSQKVSVPVEVWRDVSTKELTIAGIGKAKDGDTLSIDGVFDVRLIGIDAVEKRQTCNVNEEVWRCGEDARLLHAMMLKLPKSDMMEIDRLDNKLIFRIGGFSLQYTALEIRSA